MSYIYFIQAQDNGPIKIGVTGDDPRKRMVKIQTDCPWPVRLLGAIEGTASQEKQIHLVLGRFKTQGEWFEPHPVVMAAVNLALECGAPVTSDVPPPMKPIEHIRKRLFHVSQATFGEIAGTTQASVSRWEQGSQEPSQSELERIRNEAVLRGINWDDRWFFEIPTDCTS